MRLALVITTVLVMAGAFFLGAKYEQRKWENKALTKEVNANTSRQRTNHENKNKQRDIIINELVIDGWLRND